MSMGKNSSFIFKTNDPRHGMGNNIIIYAQNIEVSFCIFKERNVAHVFMTYMYQDSGL